MSTNEPKHESASHELSAIGGSELHKEDVDMMPQPTIDQPRSNLKLAPITELKEAAKEEALPSKNESLSKLLAILCHKRAQEFFPAAKETIHVAFSGDSVGCCLRHDEPQEE